MNVLRRPRLTVLTPFLFVLAVGCGAGAEATDDVQAREVVGSRVEAESARSTAATPDGALEQTGPGAPAPAPSGVSAHARAEPLETKLGVGPRFLIGLGNDVDADPNQAAAYDLGTKLDLHYMYLSGLDWPKWNSPEGAYVTRQAEAAKAHGVVPMFTLY